MGASSEAAGGAVSCCCHSSPPRILSDSQARHLLSCLLEVYSLLRAPPALSCQGGGINCCQPPFHTPDNKREPPRQCLRKINKLPEPLQLNMFAYLTEMFLGKEQSFPERSAGCASSKGHRASCDRKAASLTWLRSERMPGLQPLSVQCPLHLDPNRFQHSVWCEKIDSFPTSKERSGIIYWR